jgi:hypothetical protein
MNPILARLGELLRPSSMTPPADPARTLTIDLVLATAGFAIFGAAIATGGGALWHLMVAGKVAGAFLTAFVLCLAPLYSIKRFFEIEAPFSEIVSGFGSHLALGGIFTAAGAGLYLLLSTADHNLNGALAAGFVIASIAGVLICRAKSPVKWLRPFPALVAVSLFASLLAQSAWAFRPYLDPHSPTLFQARLEWFAGEKREMLEQVVIELGGRQER